MFGVSDGILDITRRSGMVRRIRFIYRKVLELFWKVPEVSEIFRKVLEGSRRKVREGPGLGGTKPWPTKGPSGAHQRAGRRPNPAKFGLKRRSPSRARFDL